MIVVNKKLIVEASSDPVDGLSGIITVIPGTLLELGLEARQNDFK